MGFFDSASKIGKSLGAFQAGSALFGGAQSSQSVPASGFYSMPKGFQTAYKQYTNQLGQQFKDPAASAAAFTPMPLTEGEQSGIDAMYGGFTPTAETLGQDISMLMNPYDEYVINGINREATGQNSLVNQAATMAGQQGSNRSFLGTSDVEQNRLNSIGMFRQGQYNTTIDNILSKLVPQRQQDAYNSLAAGSYQRDLDTKTKMAPYSALGAYGSLLGQAPTNFGNNYAGGTVSTGSSAGGIFDTLSKGAGLAGAISQLAPLFAASDINLKENIIPVGEENGYPIYEFNYIGDDQKYIGVMAQDVEKVTPEAIGELNGYKTVNYDMIGVKMRAV